MPRVISLIVLLVIILLVGVVFFQVMAEFIVPLFLACVLLVVFQPLHAEILRYVPRWPRLGALLTTVAILIAVLLPLVWLGWNAYLEAEHAVKWLQGNRGKAFVSQGLKWLDETVPQVTGRPFEPPTAQEILSRITSYIGPVLLTGVRTILGIIIGLAIMVVSLYFFLADGPKMIRAIMQISPLDKDHELELLARFGQISRSVVVATLASAIAQGIAAGIGYYFWLPPEAPVFLLTALTMVFAIIPFVGAAGVWVPVCIGMFVMGGNGEFGSNWISVVSFAIYCTVIVSGLDNLIKPYVLHGQANLHPLLALLSILGGVKVLGPIGILVGPMLVSFMQALLSIFQREMRDWENPQKRLSHKLSPAAEALAETIEAAVGGDAAIAAVRHRSITAAAAPANKPASPAKRNSGKSRRRRR